MFLVWAITMVLFALDWFAGRPMTWMAEWGIGIWGCFPLAVYALNRVSLSSLRVERVSVPIWLHAGQEGRVAAEIGNASGRFRNGVDVGMGDQWASASGQQDNVVLSMQLVGRGEFHWPGLTLRSSFPFGFFVLSRQTASVGTTWVYPALEPRVPAWPSEAVGSPDPARSGDDIVAMRDYVVGDPLRSLDWKASARKGTWTVREFERERTPCLMFRWEHVQALGLEKGLERLAAWVARAHKQGLVYGVQLGPVTIEQGLSEDHYHECMRALATFRGEGA